MDQTPIIGVFWDFENVRPANIYTSAFNVQLALERALPNISIDITAYGNTYNLLPHHKLPLYDSAIRLVNIADTQPSAGDRFMMKDMFHFALVNMPPSYVILISGDADFCPTFTALHDLGYTTVLIFQPGRESKLLRNLSDHTFFWDDMCKGHLVSPISNDAILRLAQRIDRVRPFEPPAYLGKIGGVANAAF
ncbi:chromo domain protein LHP1 [Tanacetum coccineum]|uniref:Chromo domain protein LHP1 n=1 Tax=Tanacetum coccineum TaxID=301880 RepID=A0ABQ5D372_9ASTR